MVTFAKERTPFQIHSLYLCLFCCETRHSVVSQRREDQYFVSLHIICKGMQSIDLVAGKRGRDSDFCQRAHIYPTV
jgi:hypothetical protein